MVSQTSSTNSKSISRWNGFWRYLLSMPLGRMPGSTSETGQAKNWGYLEWAEKAAIENLRGRLANADGLRSESNTLLTLMLAGIGGSLAYAFKTFDAGGLTAVAFGAIGVAIWLMLVGATLMKTCVLTRPMPALFNEPKNIYRPDLNLTETEIRGYELENLQSRIDAAKARNREVAWWLDRCRLATLAIPLVFAAITWVAADQLDGMVHGRAGPAPVGEKDLSRCTLSFADSIGCHPI